MGGVWAGSLQEHRDLAEMTVVSPAAPPHLHPSVVVV